MASTYSEKPGSYFSGANPYIVQAVPDSYVRCLDIGCAGGQLGRALKSIIPEREVRGFEFVEHAAVEAREYLDEVVLGDIEVDPIPFDKGAFDLITFGDVLEHLREPWDALKRITPYLSDDGLLICNVPNVCHFSVILELLQGNFRYAESGLLDKTHLRFFTPSSFREMLAGIGYDVIYAQPAFAPNDAVTKVLADAMARLSLPFESVMRNSSIFQYLTVSKKSEAIVSVPRSPRPTVCLLLDAMGGDVEDICKKELKEGDHLVHRSVSQAELSQDVVVVVPTNLNAIPGWLEDLLEPYTLPETEVVYPITMNGVGLYGWDAHLPNWAKRIETDAERSQLARAYGKRRRLPVTNPTRELMAVRRSSLEFPPNNQLTTEDCRKQCETKRGTLAPACLVRIDKA